MMTKQKFNEFVAKSFPQYTRRFEQYSEQNILDELEIRLAENDGSKDQ